MKQKILNFIQSTFNSSNKSRINLFLDILSVILFFASFFSIPVFSFRIGYTYVTWALSILLFVVIVINVSVYYKYRIDSINVSLLLFLFFAVLSSAINGFEGFSFTPLLLNIASIIIYTYCVSNNDIIKPLFVSAYLATIVFILVFIIEYHEDFFALSGTRLGSAFGDQNDISLFFALNFSLSLYYLFFVKKWALKPVFVISLAASLLCGALCGSKIFILLVVFSIVFVIIAFFGKKKWYFSLLFLAVTLGLFILLLSLPVFSMIKERFLNFIYTLTGLTFGQPVTADGSTIERYNLFLNSMKMFLQKPLFGYGINGFANNNGMINAWSHNNIGEFLADFGIVGTFFFHYPLILSYVAFIQNKDKKQSLSCFQIVVFFTVCMISVAFIREKIYSYLAPVSFALLTKDTPQKLSYDFKLSSLFKSRQEVRKETNHSLKKKVLYFGNFDCQNGFAAFNRAVGNSIALNKIGYEINIYASNVSGQITSDIFLLRNGISVIEKPFGGNKNYYTWKYYIQEIKQNPDCNMIVLYNMPSLAFAKILHYCKKNHLVVISDVSEWYDTKSVSTLIKPIKFIDTFIRMRFLNYKVDGLIVISDYLKEFYEKKFKKPIVKVYPIMDYAGINHGGNIPNIKNNSKITFGYIGMNRKGKDNIDDLLPLFEKHNTQIQLIYIGKANEEITKKYSYLDNVSFVGKLNHNDLIEYYPQIDYSIIVRDNNRTNNAGFPTKFAESIFFDTPVICNEFSDTKRIIDDFGCGILIPNITDFESLINDIYSKQIISVSEDAKQHFTYNHYIEQFKHFIELIENAKNDEFN